MLKIKGKTDDEKDLVARVNRYLRRMDEEEKPYTIYGLALALDMTMKEFRETEKGKGGYSPELGKILKKAIMRIAEQHETRIALGKTNPVGSIFWLKSAQGWSDQPEKEVVGQGGISITLQVVNQGSLSTEGGKSTDIVIDADVVAPPKLAESSDTKALQDGRD